MRSSSKTLATNEQRIQDTVLVACSPRRSCRYWGVRLNTEGRGVPPPNERTDTVTTPIAHSINDAARLLGVGRTKLYELIAANEISIVKIGSRTLVPHADLVDFFEHQRRAA